MNNQSPQDFAPPLFSHAIPDTFDELLSMAEGIVTGLNTRGKLLPEIQNTAAVVGKDLAHAKARFADYDAVRDALTKILQPANRDAQVAADDYLARCKQLLAVRFGRNWNRQWHDAGFTQESTQVPKSISDRKQLLLDLADYLTAHPEHESGEFSVSAAGCHKLHDALEAAQTAVKNHPKDRKIKRRDFDQAARTLRLRLRTTIAELQIHLAPNSPHWAAFGLIPPAEKRRRRSASPKAAGTPPEPGASTPASPANGKAASRPQDSAEAPPKGDHLALPR